MGRKAPNSCRASGASVRSLALLGIRWEVIGKVLNRWGTWADWLKFQQDVPAALWKQTIGQHQGGQQGRRCYKSSKRRDDLVQQVDRFWIYFEREPTELRDRVWCTVLGKKILPRLLARVTGRMKLSFTQMNRESNRRIGGKMAW